MKNKGFTLVELLAVIAILAIIVIIALPNIMGMFNSAKKSSFTSEVKNIISAAQQQWMVDSLVEPDEIVYCRSNGEDCDNALNLSGRKSLNYYVKVNKLGEVVECYASDEEFQYENVSVNDEPIRITDVVEVEDLSQIEDSQKIVILKEEVKKNSVIISNTDVLTDNQENNEKYYYSFGRITSLSSATTDPYSIEHATLLKYVNTDEVPMACFKEETTVGCFSADWNRKQEMIDFFTENYGSNSCHDYGEYIKCTHNRYDCSIYNWGYRNNYYIDCSHYGPYEHCVVFNDGSSSSCQKYE